MYIYVYIGLNIYIYRPKYTKAEFITSYNHNIILGKLIHITTLAMHNNFRVISKSYIVPLLWCT